MGAGENRNLIGKPVQLGGYSNGHVYGTIADYDPSEGQYIVTHEDGDKEYLTTTEVMAAVAAHGRRRGYKNARYPLSRARLSPRLVRFYEDQKAKSPLKRLLKHPKKFRSSRRARPEFPEGFIRSSAEQYFEEAWDSQDDALPRIESEDR